LYNKKPTVAKTTEVLRVLTPLSNSISSSAASAISVGSAWATSAGFVAVEPPIGVTIGVPDGAAGATGATGAAGAAGFCSPGPL